MTCLLERRLVVPMGVELLQNFRNLVVFAQPKRVHDGQGKLLVDPFIAGVETVEVARTRHAADICLDRLHRQEVFQTEILVELRGFQKTALVGS